MRYRLECIYCGYKWIATFWSKPDALVCLKPGCRDSNIVMRELKSTDVFGYSNDAEYRQQIQDLEDRRKGRK